MNPCITQQPMRIAVLGGEANWAGAMELLRLLISGLVEVGKTQNLELHLLLPRPHTGNRLSRSIFKAKKSIKDSLSGRELRIFDASREHYKPLLDFLNQVPEFQPQVHFHENSTAGLNQQLSKLGINLALPLCTAPQARLCCPWIGLIFDLQHRHLFQNFASSDCFTRDIEQASLLKESRVTIAISSEAKRSILEQYPWIDEQSIHALPFSPHARAEWLEASQADVVNIYGIKPPYFLISNQFWLHKDHLTALQALHTLSSASSSEAKASVSIVCTGSTQDYRNPHHITTITDFIQQAGLSDRVHLLGHIPKRNQIELTKHALAMIQPTRYEGTAGGLSTSDAVSLGVPVLLSDIAVNREAQGRNITFFKPGDSAHLSACMQEIITNPPARPSKRELHEQAARNRKTLGQFMNSVIQAGIYGNGG